MTTSTTYCKIAHISMAVQNEGDVCVCNKNTHSLEDGRRNKMYLHEVGLERMWNSPTRKLIITALDHNRRIESCQACWNDEDSGIQSMRQRYNEQLKDLEIITDQPQILILKPTNTCNLGCRTCQPATSTTLYQDFYKLDAEVNGFDGTFKDYTSKFETIRLGLGKNNDLVWDPFEKWLPGLTFLDIYGGEPMLAPAMWDRMISAVGENKTSNLSIQFHTNAVIWNQKYIDTLPKFKSVNIGISIDSNRPDQLSYIRNGVEPEKLYKNLEKYIELTKEHKSITAYISFTLSTYNVWYVDEILLEIKKIGLPVGLNIVYGPDQYDIRHLPVPVKSQIIEKLTNHPEFSKHPEFNKIVKFLNYRVPGCDIYWPKFWKEVLVLDRIRKQSFKEVFPEYYQAISPYLPK